jgi:hypothetical protein
MIDTTCKKCGMVFAAGAAYGYACGFENDCGLYSSMVDRFRRGPEMTDTSYKTADALAAMQAMVDAAEKRGADRERERCAKVADKQAEALRAYRPDGLVLGGLVGIATDIAASIREGRDE